MNKEDIVEQLIKNSIYDYEIKPGNELWSQINSSLDQRYKAKKRNILFKRISICSAAAILLFFALISIIPNKRIDKIAKLNDNSEIIEATEFNAIENGQIDKESNNNSKIGEPAKHIAQPAKNITESVKNVTTPANSVATSASVSKEETLTNNKTGGSVNNSKTATSICNSKSEAYANNNAKTFTKNNNDASVNNFNTAISTNRKAVANNNISVTISNKKPTKLSAAILTNLSGAGTDKTINTFRMSAPAYGGVEGHNNIFERVSDVKYSLPISFGIQTQMGINDKVKVGVGVNYTLLKSKYDCLINKKFHNIRQTIHYIGIPINLYFNIVNNSNFYVYANLGGSIEKGLRINYNYKSYDKIYNKGESVPGLQYSVNAGIGIEYILYKSIGIYIEPNAVYYFKSDIPASIRTDQPLQIKAELGVRYHFGN